MCDVVLKCALMNVSTSLTQIKFNAMIYFKILTHIMKRSLNLLQLDLIVDAKFNQIISIYETKQATFILFLNIDNISNKSNKNFNFFV